MAVDVKIEATGLALCFKKPPPGPGEEIWNIAFLCDQHHPLDLIINGQAKEDWRPSADIFLDVVHTGTDNCRDTNFVKLLNISDNAYGHGRNSQNPTLSNLNIERRPQRTTLVWMRVPRSILSVSGSEHTKIVKTDPEHGVPKKVRNRGKTVTLKFDVPDGLQLVPLTFPTGAPIPEFPAIDVGPTNGEIDIVFENRCTGPGCARNDFVDLYEFVVHMDGNDEVRYITWAEDAETEVIAPTGDAEGDEAQETDTRGRLDEDWDVVEKSEAGMEIQKREFKGKVDAKIASPYGNCDPVGSEPPPGP